MISFLHIRPLRQILNPISENQNLALCGFLTEDRRNCLTDGFQTIQRNQNTYRESGSVAISVPLLLSLTQNQPKGNCVSYGKWYGIKLTEENKKQFLISRDFAHGFLLLLLPAIFTYLIAVVIVWDDAPSAESPSAFFIECSFSSSKYS